MAKNPGKEEEKHGEKRRSSWASFITNVVILVGGGANAIYRARGERLDFIVCMVLMFSNLLGFIVCMHFQDGRQVRGKIMIAAWVFMILLCGNLGWLSARVFEFGVVGHIVCPLVSALACLALVLVLHKCCPSKEAAVVPIED